MKKERLEDHVMTMLNIILLFILMYFWNYLSIANSENIWELVRTGFMEFIRYFFIPFIIFSFTAFQFVLANSNREITLKKNLIELEDKTIKEFGEIKEILEAIHITSSDSYKELLNLMKVKDKSVEEKLLDKIEGKRFKFTTNYDNEEVEYKKQIKKMNNIIQRNIENTKFFLEKNETFFDLTEEDINLLKNNSKKINEYFVNNYNKTPLNEKIPTAENRSSRSRKQQENKNLTWSDVQNAAKDMIIIIDKI